MRRVLLLSTLLALAVSCGGDDGAGAGDTTETTAAPVTTTASSTSADGSGGETAPSSSTPAKPQVSIPASLPTELVVTDLVAGEGPTAEEGSTVIVNYVGVRSADGTEFDNSYDRGQPFPVVLGQGGVIAGWEQGLLGARTGMRRQLDIPADLAYGDNPQGDVIQAGDALTFVVDVVVVVPPSSADDEPDVSVPTSSNATATTVEDLVDGEGPALADGSTAFVQILAFAGDTGEQLDSTWQSGGPVQLGVSRDATIPGLYEGLVGMKVGGRRQVVIPPEDAFGPEGSEDLGLAAGTDLILVIDLLAAY
jgi:peptidylprolyl isomerase